MTNKATEAVDAFFGSARSPFQSVTPEAITSFKGSLRFSGDKLVHADYADLADHLDKPAIKSLFLSLGVREADFDAYSDLRCTGSPPICFPGPGYCDPGECGDRGGD